MNLLLDTHALAWFGAGSQKLSTVAREAMESVDARLFVSAVTAYEYADLLMRGRLPQAAPLERLIEDLDLKVPDYPGEAWQIAGRLPAIHRDPVDRMMIAHALHGDLTLITADKNVRRYPVKTLW
jgi:PIN domain nuclease of toxin-antitoxin system